MPAPPISPHTTLDTMEPYRLVMSITSNWCGLGREREREARIYGVAVVPTAAGGGGSRSRCDRLYDVFLHLCSLRFKSIALLVDQSFLYTKH
ncbi:hypothetical protein MSG28_015361 [Choristoneura fumiferana]|uniref:Uncharacterized protein n=1 Tax=Choristoneura fumiferana TaxID=7141 RepID=A0ACC0KAJ6_CHOFU|nr:hypothetical protein MSG28_015361 [Choristoneura fumiferana]